MASSMGCTSASPESWAAAFSLWTHIHVHTQSLLNSVTQQAMKHDAQYFRELQLFNLHAYHAVYFVIMEETACLKLGSTVKASNQEPEQWLRR